MFDAVIIGLPPFIIFSLLTSYLFWSKYLNKNNLKTKKTVRVPESTPSIIATKISTNISTDYFTDLYVTRRVFRKFFSFVVEFFG